MNLGTKKAHGANEIRVSPRFGRAFFAVVLKRTAQGRRMEGRAISLRAVIVIAIVACATASDSGVVDPRISSHLCLGVLCYAA